MASKFKEVYRYTDLSGSYQSITLYGKSKQETDLKFQQFLMSGCAIKSNAPLLKDFINDTYRDRFIEPLADSTKANYENYIRLYLIPFFGDMRMNDITIATVQDFYDWMADVKKINCKSIDRISGFASRVFNIAEEMGIISSTPFKKKLLINHGTASGHHKALPDDLVTRVKQGIPKLANERQRLYMGLLAYTGMRREEVLGLTWDNVFLDEGYGEIHQVVVYPNNTKAIVKPTPKTKYSERTFLIPSQLEAILRPSQRASGFVVFGDNHDSPLSPSTMKRTYKQAFKELGLSGYDNHDWRATFATQLKESGLTSAQVADLMGHADTRMVETVYARTRQKSVLMHKNTLERLNNAV